jgi:hypothetical protein
LLQALNLTFEGVDIVGLWAGQTGRLRLFRVEDMIVGDYDWKGREWVGHVRGQFHDNVFRFNWSWDLSAEKGNGYSSILPRNGRW